MNVFQGNLIQFLKAFFPLQLIFSHFKHNIPGVLSWLIFFLIITGNLGARFGLPILFFSPEYLGETSWLSYLLLGFGFGGLMMAFNSYSYSKLCRRYPFFIFVRRPFLRFCKNNSILPLTFFVLYLFRMLDYQMKEEYVDFWTLFSYVGGFVAGVLSFVFISILYFFPMSFSVKRFNLFSDEDGQFSFVSAKTPHQEDAYHKNLAQTKQRYLFFGPGLRLLLSRTVDHIEEQLVQKVLRFNRVNTSVFELITILMFVSLSLFSDVTLFAVPAAMSIVLLVTMLLMLYSIVQTWLKKWTWIFVVCSLLVMNYLSKTTEYFTYRNYAYGMDYSEDKKPVYSVKTIHDNAIVDSISRNSESYKNYIRILENWKKNTGQERPKLVIINSSGGGLRSALWTFNVLQKVDKESNGNFRNAIHLFTGASGGLVGASYFRELALREAKGEVASVYASEYYDNLGKDVLNKLAFSASTRDMFFRFQEFEYGGFHYPKDRGYEFEEQLHSNTNYVLDHHLGYYDEYEKSAAIPMIVFTPTIVNDGRRMLMSSQPLQFLTAMQNGHNYVSRTVENVDFQSFFKDNMPQNIRFSTVIRASATFPFVTPMITLPTAPGMQLMDAGLRDNYGGKLTIEVLYHLQDWIQKNTSGVVIVQIRDTKKVLSDATFGQVSMFGKITLPFGNMYSNFPRTQDFDLEELFKVARAHLPFEVDVVQFSLREKVEGEISLSWHLSSQEKHKIQRAFYSELNQLNLEHLKLLLN